MAYFAGHRATHLLVFPCCMCAQFLGDVTKSAVYIAATGPYRGFWVASCTQDLCEYIGDYLDIIHKNEYNSLQMTANSTTRIFFHPGQRSGKEVSKP
jgi:hypothetical protein